MGVQFLFRHGVRLAYERRGQGPLVALVQGLGLPGRMWLAVPDILVKGGHSVILPDARGTGLSDRPAPPYCMRTFAKDLAAVIRHVGQGPAIVVGISMGGMVAQHLALRSPELVAGLVLAATTCGLPHGRLPDPRFALLVLRSVGGDRAAVEAIHRLLVHPDSLRRNPRLFERWDREQANSAMSWKGITGHICAALTHSTGFALHRIQCPTVVVTGDHDEVIPPENSRILARRIPGAELMMLPAAGHAFPLEQPAALSRAIRTVRQRLQR